MGAVAERRRGASSPQSGKDRANNASMTRPADIRHRVHLLSSTDARPEGAVESRFQLDCAASVQRKQHFEPGVQRVADVLTCRLLGTVCIPGLNSGKDFLVLGLGGLGSASS